MENINNEKINIFGLNIHKADYGLLLSSIYIAITKGTKLTISYANARTLNEVYSNPGLRDILNAFDIIHPDGIGTYFASRLLFGKNGIRHRMTGSDFYPILINEAVKRKWKIYFFGHDLKTLERIKAVHKELQIAGYTPGFDYNTEQLIENINGSEAQILVAGLGFPVQEEWIFNNREKITCNVIMAVGDGIKVFSNTKIRGPVFVRKLGFEWLVRFFTNPVKYWKRYILGNPLFLYRIIKRKMSKFAKT